MTIDNNMKTVCKLDACTGCMACIGKCHKNAIKIVDELSSFNAVIDQSICVHCGQCSSVCPNNTEAKKINPSLWYQGWANDEKIRLKASSGGIATALAIAFVKNGGVCCSCVFENGEFVFKSAINEEEVKYFTGSKYVKSNPIGIYKKIKKYIEFGKKVLFIGLPCQVAAVKNFMGSSDLLYTVDLICHGTPSPRILEMFLSEHGYALAQLSDIKFREKLNFYLPSQQARKYKNIEPLAVKDQYTFSFLRSLDYTDNCYLCQYATMERVSDITIGDSWGSTLPQEEQDKGISLILCQNEHGQELLAVADLHLMNVNINLAIENNKQLMYPSKRPEQRNCFFTSIKNKKNFTKSVKKVYPKECFRQDVKAFLIKAKIIQDIKVGISFYISVFNTDKEIY